MIFLKISITLVFYSISLKVVSRLDGFIIYLAFFFFFDVFRIGGVSNERKVFAYW